MEFITKSAQETKEAGKRFAASLIEGQKKTLTVGLVGELGAGKTTFVQGFAEGLGITTRVISPSFILMRKFNVPGDRFSHFYHVDLYRLEENVAGEVKNIGLDDVWEKKGNIVFIEWAEKVADMIPNTSYQISFKIINKDERRIAIEKHE